VPYLNGGGALDQRRKFGAMTKGKMTNGKLKITLFPSHFSRGYALDMDIAPT
jgi:hypothetical protein